jgi:hypothetical protein
MTMIDQLIIRHRFHAVSIKIFRSEQICHQTLFLLTLEVAIDWILKVVVIYMDFK